MTKKWNPGALAGATGAVSRPIVPDVALVTSPPIHASLIGFFRRTSLFCCHRLKEETSNRVKQHWPVDHFQAFWEVANGTR